MAQGEYKKAIGDRFQSVRFRTWTLTAIIVVVLIFYYLVNVTTRNAISWIDFLLLCVVQLLAHFIYFPDGDLFGQKDPSFIANRDNYNTKADNVNLEDKHESLREFCDYEYKERKKRYILTQCGYIGISLREFEELKKLSKKQLKHLQEHTFTEKVKDEKGEEKDKEKIVKFSRQKRKLLLDLMFKPLPVQKNHPETIMSAVENDGSKKIKDGSKGYARWAHVKKFLTAILFGGVLAYVAYTVRDGFGLAEIVAIIMCMFSLVATAVMSFTSGEQCSRVYKSRFYLELGNFLDEFFEWDKHPKQSTLKE